MVKRILRPERLRQVPPQFSWVDQRLVRDGYPARVGAEALALYLFLVTVSDAQGLSYYGDAALAQHLTMDGATLARARTALVHADLVAYERPLYQVLALKRSEMGHEHFSCPRGGEMRSVAAVLRQALGNK